jgi:hypothetical protein
MPLILVLNLVALVDWRLSNYTNGSLVSRERDIPVPAKARPGMRPGSESRWGGGDT